MILDFAAVGGLASIDLLVRQEITNGSAGAFSVLAGVTGGGDRLATVAEVQCRFGGRARDDTRLLVGTANGALLIQPTHWTSADQVPSLLLVGSRDNRFGAGRARSWRSGWMPVCSAVR